MNSKFLALLILFAISTTGWGQVYYAPMHVAPTHVAPSMTQPSVAAQPASVAGNRVPARADVSHLRLRKQTPYLLDAGDTLGIFAEGVIGERDSSPPVHFPGPESDLPPSMGFPIVVRHNGTISLPLIDPISVRGLSIIQAEEIVKQAYRGGESPVLKKHNRILVTLMRKRTINVTVIRQDNSQSTFGNRRRTGNRAVTDRADFSSRGANLQLPAGRNDVINALIETGGLPGVNAQPYVRVYQSSGTTQFNLPRTSNRRSEFPRSHTGGTSAPSQRLIPTANPVSYGPNGRIIGNRETSELRNGDVVFIEAKPTEVYYTGGLLGGGEFALPRDIQLDVLQAVAQSGNSFLSNTGGRAGNVPPSQLLVLRRTPNGGQVTLNIDLNQAIVDPSQRIAVQAGDTLILRHQPREQVLNFGRDVFFTFGIRELFR